MTDMLNNGRVADSVSDNMVFYVHILWEYSGGVLHKIHYVPLVIEKSPATDFATYDSPEDMKTLIRRFYDRMVA